MAIEDAAGAEEAGDKADGVTGAAGAEAEVAAVSEAIAGVPYTDPAPELTGAPGVAADGATGGGVAHGGMGRGHGYIKSGARKKSLQFPEGTGGVRPLTSADMMPLPFVK